MNNQNPCSDASDTGLRWLTGNIRRKLTLFVVGILIMIIGLFWIFSVYLLQPVYENSIKIELSHAIATVVNILNEASASGEEVMQRQKKLDGTLVTVLTEEVIDRLNKAVENGSLNLTGRCLDIADANARNVLVVDNLKPNCLLHMSYENGITADGVLISSELNGDIISLIRMSVLQNGTYVGAINNDHQIVIGSTAADGSLSVVVSANLERIPQAVNVLKRLLLPLSLLLGLFSITAAWFFSRWFTRPLSRLSAAAREMARGNYNVRVADCGTDEIGDLSRDFNAMAEEVGRSAELQRDLMANVSHDLRTPLTLIKGYAETVRDLTGDDAEKRTEQLNVIVDESDRLSALVGSVLELSRMSSGAERPEPVDFDLAQLGDEVGYRYDVVSVQMGYDFHFSGQEGSMVHSDPKLLERALHNLLGNALKHVGADGYIGLNIFKTDHGTVRCEVADHGEGIAEEDMPHLFDKYYRSRADSGKPGTGLGLSITKAIFESLSLAYGVESRPGMGATFWFEVPQLPPVHGNGRSQ